jgi:hypothetical protein
MLKYNIPFWQLSILPCQCTRGRPRPSEGFLLLASTSIGEIRGNVVQLPYPTPRRQMMEVEVTSHAFYITWTRMVSFTRRQRTVEVRTLQYLLDRKPARLWNLSRRNSEANLGSPHHNELSLGYRHCPPTSMILKFLHSLLLLLAVVVVS